MGTLLFPPWLRADNRDSSSLGGMLKWARLKTQSRSWNRHARADPLLLQFMRTNTSLQIDSRWYAADVENLDQMLVYPFLFSEGLHHVTDETGLGDLREYIQRGGFIFTDACINTRDVNPDPDAFLQMEIAALKTLLPDARVESLPSDHDIFHIVFDLKDGLPHTYMDNIYNPAWAKHGLYVVYSSNRLVSMISLSGLQCGWDTSNVRQQEHVDNCMKMMLNIYAYAATHLT